LDDWLIEDIMNTIGETKFRPFQDEYDALIIGAAGNDSGPSGSWPIRLLLPVHTHPTRYPARYNYVVGVGAQMVTSIGTTSFWSAPYSNIADEPPKNGIIAFGGNVLGNPIKSSHPCKEWEWTVDPEHGMLGLYIAPHYPITQQRRSGTIQPGLAGNPSMPVQNTTGWARWAGTSFATAVTSGMLALMCCLWPVGRSLRPRLILASLMGACQTEQGKPARLNIRQG
jgi:hypothetical protein